MIKAESEFRKRRDSSGIGSRAVAEIHHESGEEIMITHIHATTIVVSDQDKALHFYCDVLG